MSYENILFESGGGIARITLNRPDRLNSFTDAMHAELRDALAKVKSDSSLRALLLTGAGNRAFCAGADIKELMGRSLRAQREGAAFGQAVFIKLDALPIPSIALINGYAFGDFTGFVASGQRRIARSGMAPSRALAPVRPAGKAWRRIVATVASAAALSRE